MFEPCIEHLIACGKSSSTLCWKLWVFSRFSGFLPQGGWGFIVREIIRNTVNIDCLIRLICCFGTWCNRLEESAEQYAVSVCMYMYNHNQRFVVYNCQVINIFQSIRKDKYCIAFNRLHTLGWQTYPGECDLMVDPQKVQRHFLTNAFCYLRTYITCTKIQDTYVAGTNVVKSSRAKENIPHALSALPVTTKLQVKSVHVCFNCVIPVMCPWTYFTCNARNLNVISIIIIIQYEILTCHWCTLQPLSLNYIRILLLTTAVIP